MTDKQMEEKKREFMEKFFVDIEFGEYDQGLILGKEEVEEMWQWIEKLVEEVEREKNVEIIKRLKEYQLGLENYIEEYGLNRIEAIKVNEFGIKDN